MGWGPIGHSYLIRWYPGRSGAIRTDPSTPHRAPPHPTASHPIHPTASLNPHLSVHLIPPQATYRGSKPWDRLVEMAGAAGAESNAVQEVGRKAGQEAGQVGCKRARLPSVGSDVGSPPADVGSDVGSLRTGVGSARDDAGPVAGAPRLALWRDKDEWKDYSSVGSDPVVHVDLAKRNQLLLLAPLCANTLASVALGQCGSLLTSVVRAWYYDLEPSYSHPLASKHGPHSAARPVVVAPAMNSVMWHQSITSQHVATLTARGVILVPPVCKTLACGDVGVGAMAEVGVVVEAALDRLRAHHAAQLQAAAQGFPPFTV